jgi:hypothetical protein
VLEESITVVELKVRINAKNISVIKSASIPPPFLQIFDGRVVSVFYPRGFPTIAFTITSLTDKLTLVRN